MIEIKDLHKGFDGVQVLKGINTVFEPGKTSLIIGQSGSGKTVFLKSLIGLHTPEQGTISYDGKLNIDFTLEQKRARAIATLFCIPPESSAGNLKFEFSRFTLFNTKFTRSNIFSSDCFVNIFRGNITLSCTV